MYKKNQLKLFSITVLLSFMYMGNANGFSLEEMQQKINELTNQILSGYQSSNNCTNNASNKLDINPNETKVTHEISPHQPKVIITCKAPGGCRFNLVIMQKQTIDGYTTYENLKNSEVINLSYGNNIDVNVSNVKGSYILSLKNLNKIPMTIEYSVLGDSSLVPNSQSLSGSHSQSNDLGRIKFEQVPSNSHTFLSTPNLKPGSYTFTIIPSSKRSNITFIPEGIGVSLNVYVVNMQGKEEVITSNRVGSFTIANPLITRKGNSIKVNITTQSNSKVYVISI